MGLQGGEANKRRSTRASQRKFLGHKSFSNKRSQRGTIGAGWAMKLKQGAGSRMETRSSWPKRLGLDEKVEVWMLGLGK